MRLDARDIRPDNTRLAFFIMVMLFNFSSRQHTLIRTCAFYRFSSAGMHFSRVTLFDFCKKFEFQRFNSSEDFLS